MIYADNAATTKLDTDAFEAMKPFLLDDYSNPSQLYSFSRRSRQAIKQARADIADCIGAKPEQIFFTSGGTESNNWVIKNFGRDLKCIFTTNIEHHSVLNACKSLKYGVTTYFEVEDSGLIDVKKISHMFIPPDNSRKQAVPLCSVMTANNEIGTIQNIALLSAAAHKQKMYFHTDAVQAVGHIPIDVEAMGVDFLSASGHKFNGPKGIGFLYCRDCSLLCPHEDGGSQEFGMRAGTENVAGIVGMAVALRNNVDEIEQNTNHLNHLTEVFLSALCNKGVDYILNGHPTQRLPGSINISFKKRSGEGLMHMLDLKGICVSTGSACDSQNQQVSHVIKAINVPQEYSEGTIRVTFGKENTEQEALDIVEALVKLMRIES